MNTPSSSLLPRDEFAPVFEPLRGRRIGFLRMYGSAGDRLLDTAARQLFDAYGVDHIELSWHETSADMADTDDALVEQVDEIVVAGGGNLGGLYPRCRLLRQHYLGFGKPVTILPQSITGPGEDLARYRRVFLREHTSLLQHSGGLLGPDLALGFTPPPAARAREFPLGVFLRVGKEALFAGSSLSLADPAQCCRTYSEYFALAGRFETLVTDRLHFAIAGMLAGTQVELLPVSYHKNRSMYETWLRDLGCGWRDNLAGLRYEKESVAREMADELTGKVNLGRAL